MASSFSRYSKIIGAGIPKGASQMSVLRASMQNHLAHFAFSNAHYFARPQPSAFDPERVFDDLMDRRYGLCMELNFAYSTWLQRNGIANRLVPCYKRRSSPKWALLYYDIFHLGIVLPHPVEERLFLDVGFG